MIERRAQMPSRRSSVLDRLLDDAFLFGREGEPEASDAKLNIYEEGETLVIEAQLPGVKPEEVQVSVAGNTLTIRAEGRQGQERKGRTYIVREHRTSSLTRTVELPSSVDPDQAEATFEDGILRLAFPRAEQNRARRIQIRAGGERSRSSEPVNAALTNGSDAAAGSARKK